MPKKFVDWDVKHQNRPKVTCTCMIFVILLCLSFVHPASVNLLFTASSKPPCGIHQTSLEWSLGGPLSYVLKDLLFYAELWLPCQKERLQNSFQNLLG